MANGNKNKQQNGKKDDAPKMTGTEFSDEQRHKNEVASTAYMGSKDEKTDLKDDKLESGGF